MLGLKTSIRIPLKIFPQKDESTLRTRTYNGPVQDAHHIDTRERRCESVKRRILTLTLAAVMAVSMVSGVVGTAFAKEAQPNDRRGHGADIGVNL